MQPAIDIEYLTSYKTVYTFQYPYLSAE